MSTVKKVLSSPKFWLFVAAWLATRLVMVADVGYLHADPVDYEDVHLYATWASDVANFNLPTGEFWQYPPGAALVLVIPRLGLAFGDYGESFVVYMLLVDLVGFALIAAFAQRKGNYTGVWVWILGIAALYRFPVLRFDLVPTVIAMGALFAIHRRPGWFGALAGIGAFIKVWPVVVLFGEWDRRRLARSALIAAGVFAAAMVVAAILLGNPLSFLGEQGDRGLQQEAVGATPWQLRSFVRGIDVPAILRYGSFEIPSSTADTVAKGLKLLELLALALAAVWWLARDRAIKAGRTVLANASLARDFVFTILLALVITSPVLSPQYMIWLIGVAAMLLSDPESRLHRPAWIIFGASFIQVLGAAHSLVLRNIALVVATVDAALVLGLLVWRPSRDGAASPEPREPVR